MEQEKLGIKYFIIHEISHNSIIMLLCATKEAYLEQTTLNHYKYLLICLKIVYSIILHKIFWQSLKASLNLHI